MSTHHHNSPHTLWDNQIPLVITGDDQETIATKRADLLNHLAQNPDQWPAIVTRCAQDPIFWMNQFCYTYDPRCERAEQPFVPYAFQVDLAHRLMAAMVAGKFAHDLLVEKSRDMGVSWLVALLFQHQWQFGEAGGSFLIGSRTKAMVDQRGDMSTLFEKIRFNLAGQPQPLLPQGFNSKRHSTLGKLVNPANGNSIIGEAATASFGRGGRYRAVLLDELAFWGKADAAWTACGQSTRCRLAVSTPNGQYNLFARVRFEGNIAVATVHWRLHPGKDQDWYEAQQRRMSKEEVARELDINYSGSLSDRMFPQFGPQHVRELAYHPGRTLVRVWDFGYQASACLWMQTDEAGRLLVLRERVMRETGLLAFARQVLADTREHFSQAMRFEDWVDPAGWAHSTIAPDLTCVSILEGLGIYPQRADNRIAEGVARVRHLLETMRREEAVDHTRSYRNLPSDESGAQAPAEKAPEAPALLVDSRACPVTVEALAGGYRHLKNEPDVPRQDHPYEDVMDCLRYGVMSHGQVWSQFERERRRRMHRPRRYITPRDPMTGY